MLYKYIFSFNIVGTQSRYDLMESTEFKEKKTLFAFLRLKNVMNTHYLLNKLEVFKLKQVKN